MADRPTYDYVAGLYRDLLGREGSQGEIEGHLNNPGGDEGVRQLFLGSPEYTSTHGGTPTWQDVGGDVTYTNPADNPNPPPPDQPTYIPPPTYGPQGGDTSAQGGYASGTNFAPTTGDWAKLQGFNADNYYNPEMNSVKYTFARLANEYEPTPEGLKRLVADPRFKAAFPNAKLVDFDKIDFGGALSEGKTGSPVGVIDVGGGFNAQNNTGKNWWWGYQPDAIGAPTGGGGTSGLPSGTTRTTSSSGGTGNLQNYFQQLGSQIAGPGGPGITNGPLQQVGQDPLSLLISGALGDFIGNQGTTPFGRQVSDKLMSMLDNGGLPDQNSMNKRFESARELLDKGRRTMINDARGDLANRGLLSEPGIPQGAETGAVRRITENLAPEFSRTLRDITTDEAQRADQRVSSALQMATGMADSQAKTFLAGIGEGTARQTALAQIALQELAQNQSWSQFLAEFGLKRDTVLQQLQQGRVDDVTQLMNMFLSLSGMANQGYI